MYCDFFPSIWFQVLLIFAIAFLVGGIARKFLNRVAEFSRAPEWLRTLAETFAAPSLWMVWGYGFLLGIEQIASIQGSCSSQELIAKGRNILFVLIATWIFFRWKARFEGLLKKRVARRRSKQQDEALIDAVGRLVSILGIIISSMITLDIMEIQLTAILALGGIGGLAVSWAGKDIVANFLGGFEIFINRPFAVGDWIMSPNKGFEGTVEEIGWYMTQIRTFERRPTYIPNSVLTDAIVENPGRMYNRRIKETIGIRIADASRMKQIVQKIEEMLKVHPAIDQKQILLVHFVAFGAYSLNIEVYCFTKTTDWKEWREVQQDVFLKIIALIVGSGGEIAFPTQVRINQPA